MLFSASVLLLAVALTEGHVSRTEESLQNANQLSTRGATLLDPSFSKGNVMHFFEEIRTRNLNETGLVDNDHDENSATNSTLGSVADEDHHDEDHEHNETLTATAGTSDHHDDHDESEEHHDHDESEEHDDHEDEDHHLEDEHDEHDEHDGEDHHDDEHGHHDENEEFENSTFSSESQKASEAEGNKPWGHMIGGTILINLTTLTGVIFLAPCCKRVGKGACSVRLMDMAISTIAAGALMAAAVLLIMPEASLMMLVDEAHDEHDGHGSEGEASASEAATGGDDGHNHMLLRHRLLQEESHAEHSEVSWKFGVSVLGGFLLPFAMSAIFPQRHRHDLDEIEHHTAEAEALQALDHSSDGSSPPDVKVLDATSNGDDDDLTPNHGETSTKAETRGSTTAGGEVVAAVAVTTNGSSTPSPAAIPREIKKPVDWGLCGAILLGDAFHNFADGIFLGSAFLTCGSAVAISVLVSTLYHEIVQELADFLVLTKHAGLSIPMALLFNFLSGFSVMLGGIVVFAVQLSDLGIGALLSISAGVYIHIAAVECMPRVVNAVKSRLDYLYAFGMFAAGAIPIGLVLLAHQHCEA